MKALSNVYKLRNKVSGLYSDGVVRNDGTFKTSTVGKAWSKQQHVISHLELTQKSTAIKENLNDWEVVLYTLTEADTVNLTSLLNTHNQQVEIKRQKYNSKRVTKTVNSVNLDHPWILFDETF